MEKPLQIFELGFGRHSSSSHFSKYIHALELLTFEEVVGPETFTVLHVFHHIISKFVHVS